MTYIVLETQTDMDGVTGTIVNSYKDQNEAESRYHAILSAAAISTVPKHCAFLLTDSARVLKSDVYIHDVITVEEGEVIGDET